MYGRQMKEDSFKDKVKLNLLGFAEFSILILACIYVISLHSLAVYGFINLIKR